MTHAHGKTQTTGTSRRDVLRSAAGVTAWLIGGRIVAAQASDSLKPSNAIKDLIVHTASPHNAEPAPTSLLGNWITPVEHFFVRSHAAKNPDVDPASFRVSVDGLVERPLELSLGDLRRFPQTSVDATLTCAGNRREEHNAVRKVSGVQWRTGAIGNARWQGVPLADILKRAGVKPEARHVWFESIDQVQGEDGSTFGFGGSIPLEKALNVDDDRPGALVTLRMNEAPLAPDHGFPVRMVVPGYVGARSVKWLGRIVVSDQPSPNHYVAGAYRVVTNDTPLDWVEAAPIYKYPVNAVICEPAPDSALKPGRTAVRGYALPPGNGATIERVELSTDGGQSWTTAEITSRNTPYCWVLWQAKVPVAVQTSQLIVRATDSDGLTQPQVVPWNLKGYLYNAWHHVPVTVRS